MPEFWKIFNNRVAEDEFRRCAAKGRVRDIRRMLAEGVDIDAQFTVKHYFTGTALHYAARAGKLNAIVVLLDAGAPPNRRDARGQTPFSEACARGYLEIAQRLLNHGADINPHDDRGNTPLHAAAQRGDVRVVKFLLERGADPTRRNNDGRTPRDRAREERQGEANAVLCAHNPRKLLPPLALHAPVTVKPLKLKSRGTR